MIRQLGVFAVALISLSLSTTTNAAAPNAAEEKDSSRTLKRLQDAVSYVYESKPLDDDTYNAGRDYDLRAVARRSNAKYQAIVTEFLERYKSGVMLPRGALFSANYGPLMDETVLIFKVFYHAPSLWDLTCVAVWSYINVNKYQVFYALDIALSHRKDTTRIKVPPPYKTTPEFYFNSDFIKQVYDFKIGLNNLQGKSNEPVTFVAEAKYTNWYTADTADNAEWNLTYFTEDVSLNIWNFNPRMSNPTWMSSKEYNLPIADRRGEIYGYMMRFILSRYNCELLSNNLDKVEFIEWGRKISIGYYPSMSLPNGMHFPHRDKHSTVAVNKIKYLDRLRKTTIRISEAIDRMAIELIGTTNVVDISNETGINILGNVILGNRDSVNPMYYGDFDNNARNILGFSPEPQTDHQVLPNALQYRSTSLRDPAFYRLARRAAEFFIKFQANLPRYTKRQLGCDGVKINAVNIAEGNVTTYFEYIDTEISEFWFDCNKRSAIIKARQYRLNHAPVTFNLNIVSDRKVNVIVRIFVAPKFNLWGKPLSQHYRYFYEVDYFLKELKKGKNTFRETVGSTSNGTTFDFPNHLIFPKGKPEGLPVQFFIHMTEFKECQQYDQDTNLLIRDCKPLGYPLDRPLDNFNMPNMALLESTIYHTN